MVAEIAGIRKRRKLADELGEVEFRNGKGRRAPEGRRAPRRHLLGH